MFASLRRRKAQSADGAVAAFDSTCFSLTTDVPRPAGQRQGERVSPTLREGKLIGERSEQIVKIRNLSAGGLMAELTRPCEVGEKVLVEFSSERIPATIVWTREGAAGVKFDQHIDLGELLAGRKPRHRFRPRPPRLEVSCKARLRVGTTYYTVDVRDISLGGMKVEPIEEYCVGKPVVVLVDSLRPVSGSVAWFSERRAGVVFDEPLAFEELADWIGKRVELASLKAARRTR